MVNNISLNNTSFSELQKMLGAMQSSGEISKVSYGTMTNGVQPLKITANNGAIISYNALLPEVDPSDGGEVDETDRQKLSNSIKELSTDAASTPSTVRQNGLADMYAILALLYQVAEKQRETSLQARQSEHKAMQASLEGQAESAKATANEAYDQAIRSAVTQAVTAGISLVASSVSFGMQCKSMRSADIQVAKSDLVEANQELKIAKSLPKSTTQVELKTDNTPLAQSPEALAAKTDYAKAQGKVTKCSEDLSLSKAELNQLETNLAEDKNSLDAAKLGGDPKVIEAAKVKFEATSKAFDAKQTQVTNDMVALDKAKIECGDKALAYNAALDKALADHPDTAGLGDFAKSEKMAIRKSAVEGCESKCGSARGRLEERFKAAEKSGFALAAKGLDQLSQVSMQAGRTVAAFFDAKSQQISALSQASTKMKESEQENLKSQTESTSELCQSEQDLINFINDMLKQISQTESATVSAAIRV